MHPASSSLLCSLLGFKLWQEIQTLMSSLVEKFGCEPLVGSFMARVETPGVGFGA